MQTSHIASPTRDWFALSCAALVIAAAGCSSPRAGGSDSLRGPEERAHTAIDHDANRAVFSICPATMQRGSIQVARVDPKVEEGGVAFDLLGDGASGDVIACGDTLYADVHRLMQLMADSSKVVNASGSAVVDGQATITRTRYYNGLPYVRVDSFARNRRALMLANPGHPTDAVIWPRKALLYLKASGLTAGRAYKTAVSEGLLP